MLKDISNAVGEYVKFVAGTEENDLLKRVLAYGVLDALNQSKENKAANDFSTIVNRHLPDAFVVYVLVKDGRSQELVCDSSFRVSDAVDQIAWSEGHSDPESFAIFEDRGEGYLVLDQSQTLSSVSRSFFSINSSRQSRMRFGRGLSRVTEEEQMDPLISNVSFVQWREQYLSGDCHVQGRIAAQLADLQILAHHDLSYFQDDERLSEQVSNCIPEKV